MGLPSVLQTGRSAMNAAKAAIATTGHNISNANTEGYTRQKAQFSTREPFPQGYGKYIGRGVDVSAINRVHDQYLEKQIRKNTEDHAFLEERDFNLRQIEDIYNELDGEGLNRIVSKFFNQFRELSTNPNSSALRQTVKEASLALVADFHRMRKQLDDVRAHVDSRLSEYVDQLNSNTEELADVNLNIRKIEIAGGHPNDLKDRRDRIINEISELVDIRTFSDGEGSVNVDMHGIGPLITGQVANKLNLKRTPADEFKVDGAYDVYSSGASGRITQAIKGGRLGALLNVRDDTLQKVSRRFDEIAWAITTAVNTIHEQGFTRTGARGIEFFKTLKNADRASEVFDVSDAIKSNVNNIATAFDPEAPSDNRVAIQIAQLQNVKLLNGGQSTLDDWYNSIVGEVGIAVARNREGMEQQENIRRQLHKMRDEISAVSLDEETADLLKFQHVYDASARVISVADELMQTVLNLKRL